MGSPLALVPTEGCDVGRAVKGSSPGSGDPGKGEPGSGEPGSGEPCRLPCAEPGADCVDLFLRCDFGPVNSKKPRPLSRDGRPVIASSAAAANVAKCGLAVALRPSRLAASSLLFLVRPPQFR